MTAARGAVRVRVPTRVALPRAAPAPGRSPRRARPGRRRNRCTPRQSSRRPPEAAELERALQRVDEPRVRHPRLRVDAQLPAAIDAPGGGGEHLAHPVRGEREEGLLRHGRQPLAPPAGEVGHDDLLSEVKLGLVEDPPAPGAAAALVERSPDEEPKPGRRHRVSRGRPRAQEQLAIQDLGHLVLRGVQHVLVRRALHGLRLRTRPVYASAGSRGNVSCTCHLSPPMRPILARRRDSEGLIGRLAVRGRITRGRTTR